ncbi:MAG TPA: hypothetical protein VGA67_03470 [Candidatus Dojkabacteria bacterium]|jgi:drug/metabolite transporter (DMT)-like permease
MWVVFAFLSLLFLNARTIVTKFNVSKTHEYISIWYTFLFQIPLGVVAVLIMGIRIDDPQFFILVFGRVWLDIVAFIFFFKSLKLSSISIVLPFLALQPALSVFTSYFINGQAIEPLRLILVLIIAAACYILYKATSEKSSKGLDNKKGIIFMLIVVGLYAILDPLHAEILEISAPTTYFFISSLYFITIWSIFIFWNFRKELFKSFKDRKAVLFNGSNGVILSLEVLSLFSALVPGSITAVVSSIRSTNIAVSSILGGIIFKEKLNKRKLLLIGIITMAVILLVAI